MRIPVLLGHKPSMKGPTQAGFSSPERKQAVNVHVAASSILHGRSKGVEVPHLTKPTLDVADVDLHVVLERTAHRHEHNHWTIDCQCLIPITHKPFTLGLHYISATKVKEDEKKMKWNRMRRQKKEESQAVGEGHKVIMQTYSKLEREIIFDSSGFSAQGNLISRIASVFWYWLLHMWCPTMEHSTTPQTTPLSLHTVSQPGRKHSIVSQPPSLHTVSQPGHKHSSQSTRPQTLHSQPGHKHHHSLHTVNQATNTTLHS